MGASSAMSAAREILERTGAEKKDIFEVTANAGGMFILPPKTSIWIIIFIVFFCFKLIFSTDAT